MKETKSRILATVAVVISVLGLIVVAGAQDGQQTKVMGKRLVFPGPEYQERMREATQMGRRAQVLLRLGFYEPAESAARIVLELDPLNSHGRRVVIESHIRQRRYTDALELLEERRSRISNEDPADYAKIGLLLLRLGEVERSAMMWNPEMFAERYLRGEPARREYIPVPTTPSTLEGGWLFFAGLTEEGRGDTNAAIFYYKQAYQHIPKNPLLNYHIATAYRSTAKALEHLEIAEENSTGDMRKLVQQRLQRVRHLMRSSGS